MARHKSPADHEKQRAALSSVVGAVFLTGLKGVVGWTTGSLGILAEAAHSGLDLVAAALTLFAVRVSGRPADADHPYGHGKVENLSALVETLLLLITCVWIVGEAIERLFFKHVHVEGSVWAFLVMGLSIGVDYTRARVLMRAARKYRSQALEADALHFSTDIWSSAAVIGGLVLVRLSQWLEIPWLEYGDALAALGVCAVVVYVCIELGRRSITALIDGVPQNLRENVARAVQVPGVVEVRRVRARQSGAESFVDVVLAVQRHATLEESHEVASRAEMAIQELLPQADVMVHVEPSDQLDDGLPGLVRSLAARHGLQAHEIRFYDVLGRTSLELHLELQNAVDVATAHALATRVEEELRRDVPSVARIVTHLEPAGRVPLAAGSPATAEELEIQRLVEETARERGGRCQPHDIEVRRVGSDLSLAFHCTIDGGVPLESAHVMTEEIEIALRDRLPRLRHVTIHIEPTDHS
jgi:cation diffusion facilitator family transporter